MKQILSDLQEVIDVVIDMEPIQLYGDNQGSLAMIRNPVKHNQTKRIDIRYHFIRDYYNHKIIDIKYVETDKNIADIMTKNLPKYKLEQFKKPLFGEIN